MIDRVEQDNDNKNNKKEFILITYTTNNPDEAERLAELLVREQAAACVFLSSSVTSIYRRQKKTEMEPELFSSLKQLKRNLELYKIQSKYICFSKNVFKFLVKRRINYGIRLVNT